jgi:two-component system response regulator PhoP
MRANGQNIALRQDPPEPEAAEGHEPAKGMASTKWPVDILFVEDDDADAYLVQRILNANPRVGSVTRARDGEEALRMVATGEVHPDIGIIDLQMPRMDGMTLMRRIQELDISFAYFVFSSSASAVDMLRAFQCGTSFFLTKASRPDQLALQINTALRQF